MARIVAILVCDAVAMAISLILVFLGGQVGFIALVVGCFVAVHIAVMSRQYEELREEKRKE